MGSLYSDHPSWLHRVPAGRKLACFALAGSGMYLVHNLYALALGAVLCCLLFASLGRAWRAARRLLATVLLSCALVLALHLFLGQPLTGAISAMRLLGVALMGMALTLSTRAGDLLAVLETLLSPLQRLGVRTERLALMLSMMLRFTEHFFVLWKQLDEAHRIRTGKSGGLRLLAPLTIQMLGAARRVADTLELRLGD